MNEDAVENPTKTCLSRDFQLEIRDKHGMARKTATNESDVDPAPLGNAAKLTVPKRQVCANDISSSPLYSYRSPSHKRLRKYDWFSQFSLLRHRITPRLSALEVFSPVNKEAGDVDVASNKRGLKDILEDGVDPQSYFREKVTKLTKDDASKLTSALHTKPIKVQEKDGDRALILTRSVEGDFEFSHHVDSKVYDFEGSHSVDDSRRLLSADPVEEGHCVDAIVPLGCVDGTDGSECVVSAERACSFDTIERYPSVETVQHFNSEIFSDSADAPSSATDAPQQCAKDWQPHEAEAILSDIYKDLGEACICTVEDGCICSLEECICSEQCGHWKGLDSNVKTERAITENVSSDVVEDTAPLESKTQKRNKSQLDGTSTDLHFHLPSKHSDVDPISGQTAVRRKNYKLSDRVLCKQKLSPYSFDTEVDPIKSELGRIGTVCDPYFIDEFEDIDPSPRREKIRVTSPQYHAHDVNCEYDHEDIVDDFEALASCIATSDYNMTAAKTEDRITVRSSSSKKNVHDSEETSHSEDQCTSRPAIEINENISSCQSDTSSLVDAVKTSMPFLPADIASELEARNDGVAERMEITPCNFDENICLSEPVDINTVPQIAEEESNAVSPEPHLVGHDAHADEVEVGSTSVSSAIKSHSDAGQNLKLAKQNARNDIPERGAAKPPASYSTLKTPTNKSRVSRIPKPVSTRADKRHQVENQDQLQAIKNENEVHKDSTAADVSSVSRENPTQCNEDTDNSRSVCEEKKRGKLKMITSSDSCSKPYIPQLITFYRHKDAKVVTTIPPASPKTLKHEKTNPPNLPAWNCSTALDNQRKINRPMPLVSKRNDSIQSLFSETSGSSKQSLSSARTEESEDRVSASLSHSVTAEQSESESSASPRRSRVKKLDRQPQRGPSPIKQPFRPAGSAPTKRKFIPASNTARSHPDLRIPGCRVEVPVIYPSTVSESSSVKLSNRKGTKRVYEESSAGDARKHVFMEDRNYIYPHSVAQRCLNENSSNSVANNFLEILNSQYPYLSGYQMHCSSARSRSPNACVSFDWRFRERHHKAPTMFFDSASSLNRNIVLLDKFSKRQSPKRLPLPVRPRSKIPVPHSKSLPVRRLGDLRSGISPDSLLCVQQTHFPQTFVFSSTFGSPKQCLQESAKRSTLPSQLSNGSGAKYLSDQQLFFPVSSQPPSKKMKVRPMSLAIDVFDTKGEMIHCRPKFKKE